MMWPPADINAVPTAREVIDAKLAIEAVKIQLENALVAPARPQTRIDELNKELIEREAWIAPVRFLSFDVLSLIFEFCGEDDWRTPLLISEVSRHWRQIVLATPRAWAFLHLQGSKVTRKMIRDFFSRSGHCPLHIYMPSAKGDPTQTLSSVVEKRLRCLSIEDKNYVKDRVFPILDRLTLRYVSYTPTDISHLNNIQFPSLRHLICKTYLTSSISGSSAVTPWAFPPLQTLSLNMTGDLAWFRLLTAVKNTLISLRLEFVRQCTVQNPPMILPALKYMEVRIWCPDPVVWPLDLKTPVLEAYREATYGSFSEPLFHKDTQNVREMRSDHPPALSYFPLLEFLQLEKILHISDVFDVLASNESLSPNLQEVQIPGDKTKDFDYLLKKLADVNRRRRVPVKLVANRLSDKNLPYAIEQYSCGRTMPCNEP